MDLVFPEFVPASTGVTGAATTARKSLWELVIEASSQQPNIGGVDTFSEQSHRLDREVIPCSKEVTDDSRNFEDEMAAAITPTSRSSWLPSPYMTNNLLPKGFVQQFCTLNSIECSARIPPPPCLRMEDLQFPPFVLARLRKQLLSSSTEKSLAGRVVHPSTEKQCSEAQKPQSVKKAYIGVEATGWSAGQGADGEKIDVNEDSGGTVGDVLVLTALQQLTLTSMLLGHHTVSIAPHGTGKKTAGLLAVAGLTLAREVSPGANPPVGGDAAIEQDTLATTKASPNGPRAVILFSTYSELQRHAHWLQCVFTK
uniref:Uncharacterized protein TCIL3000_8_5420 n=1 Tax=Trypanosoma congolense (strain IL3000) TaxID=1068625 RepID=G0USF7_TRYCI|nr:unnamed protein product [Trypanosoma congolense IL3000]